MSVHDEVILNKLNNAQAKCLSFSLFYFEKSQSLLPYISKKMQQMYVKVPQHHLLVDRQLLETPSGRTSSLQSKVLGDFDP